MKLSHSETEVRRQKSLERRASRVIGVTICSQPGHQGSLVSSEEMVMFVRTLMTILSSISIGKILEIVIVFWKYKMLGLN